MDLRKFQKELHEWQLQTFPQSTALSKLTHLKKEIIELEQNPADPYEMADIIMLVCGMASIQGIDIATALETKFEVNKNRKWGIPDKDGVVSHIKE
jgi:Protein of unknown function (DUF550)